MDPAEIKKRFNWVYVWLGLVSLIALLTGYCTNKVHTFLGTNDGSNSSEWSGLVGHIEAENAFHRGEYKRIACRLWKLENPGTAEPNPCPPLGGGPPSARPGSPPAYP
jgi:hypothetical protein